MFLFFKACKKILFIVTLNLVLLSNSYASAENEEIKTLANIKTAGDVYKTLLEVAIDTALAPETISNIQKVEAIKELRTFAILENKITHLDLDIFDDKLLDFENDLAISVAKRYSKLEEWTYNNAIFEGGTSILSLCTGSYNFVQNTALVFDNNGNIRDRQIALINGLVDAKDIYASVATIATIGTKYFPRSSVAKYWANNSLSKGVKSLANFKVANRLNTVVMGAQIISSIYKASLSNTFDEINSNIISQYHASLGMRKLILDELITYYKDTTLSSNNTMNKGDIFYILTKALVINDDDETYVLAKIFEDRSNNSTYLNEKFGKTDFNDLTNKEKITLAINTLALLSMVEDNAMNKYIDKLITTNASFSAKLLSIFESSIYDVFDSSSLKEQLFPYHGTNMYSLNYYTYLYEGLFNSIAAEMQLIRQAEIGERIEKLRYASVVQQDYENQLSRLLEVSNSSINDNIALYIATDVEFYNQVISGADLDKDFKLSYKNESTNGFIVVSARFNKTLGALVFDSPLSESYELYKVSIPRENASTEYITHRLPENNSGVFIENITLKEEQSTNESVTVTQDSIKKTGQMISYVDYDDGYYQAGVNHSYTRDNINEIVTDNITKLQWQDDEEAKTITKTWEDAKTYCEDLSLGGFSDWRLPDIKELQSIIDNSKYNFSINSIFKNTYSDYYWSSTATSTGHAWYGYFNYGGSYNRLKSNNYAVRCVRAGQ